MTGALLAAPPAIPKAVAAALRTGQLSLPCTPFAIKRVAGCTDIVVAAIQDFAAGVASASVLADCLELAAAASDGERLERRSTELVWTGPEASGARSRDTAVVVAELFRTAARSILVSGYAVFGGRQV